MANMHQILLAVLIIQIHAAPSGKSENKETEQIDAKVDAPAKTEEVQNDAIAVQGQREKRQFFNFLDYGGPPINPFYQSPKLDELPQTGGYGLEGPYANIYRRLQNIVEEIKRPSYILPTPPPRSLFQFFVPVFYIPVPDCTCFPDSQISPENPIPDFPPPDNPIPDFNSIFPTDTQIPMDNEQPRENQTPMDNQTFNQIPDNQNSTSNQMPVSSESPKDSTFSASETPIDLNLPPNTGETDIGDDDDFTRPISFEPVPPPDRSTLRPPPSVEHGSMQAGSSDQTTIAPNTTGSEEDFSRPISFDPVPPPGGNVNRPSPPVEHGSVQAGSEQFVVSTTAPILESANQLSANTLVNNRIGAADELTSTETSLTACDMAVLNCCHQPEVKLSCFALENCPKLITSSNPCSANVVLTAIDRYQKFYGQKS